MKKISLAFVATMLVVNVFAQTVHRAAKECVLFELFTGVNCTYCPANANGVAQMLEEGIAIAPVAYHTSAFSVAEFYTSETNARASWYGITGYPTTKSDGILNQTGGGTASQNTYNMLVPLFNNRINVPSPFLIDMSYSLVSGSQYQVSVTVDQVGTCNASDLRIMIVYTESNIPRNWQGMKKLNCVTRDMMPNQNGTSYSGGSQTVTETFDIGNRDKENLHLVAWVQSFSSKEVFQAVRMSMNAPDFSNDVKLEDVTNLISNSCSGVIKPTVKVKNIGVFDVQRLEVVAKVGGIEVYRYPWVGEPFAYTESRLIDLPEFQVPMMGGDQDVEFVIENPNNLADPNMEGNSITKHISASFESAGYLKLIFVTDAKPQESSVEIIDMESNRIIQTFTFTQSGHTYTEYVQFPAISCYRVLFKDSGGDGLDRLAGVFDNLDNLLFSVGLGANQFESEIAVEITSTAVGISEMEEANIVVAPNPSNGFFQINTNFDENYSVVVYDIVGKKVYENSCFSDGNIDLTHCVSGAYIIKITSNQKEYTQKIIVR